MSSLLIMLSLILPMHSCIHDGQTEIVYPLSNVDSLLSIVKIIGVYTVPSLVLLVRRPRVIPLLAGIAASGLGLYTACFIFTFSSKLLVGWYINVVGVVAYLLSSLVELIQTMRANSAFKRTDTPVA